VTWVEVFIVYLVCHAVGDFLLQTEFQATRKAGGLGSDPVARRALFSHLFTYSLCFIPAFIWVADKESGRRLVATIAVVGRGALGHSDSCGVVSMRVVVTLR